jgi:hypothetical protein
VQHPLRALCPPCRPTWQEATFPYETWFWRGFLPFLPAGCRAGRATLQAFLSYVLFAFFDFLKIFVLFSFYVCLVLCRIQIKH